MVIISHSFEILESMFWFLKYMFSQSPPHIAFDGTAQWVTNATSLYSHYAVQQSDCENPGTPDGATHDFLYSSTRVFVFSLVFSLACII